MRRIFLSTCYTLAVLLFTACTSNKLPQQAKDMFFNSSDFSKAIFIYVPAGDSRDKYNKIANTPAIYEQVYTGGINIPTVNIEIGNDKKIEDFDKSLLSFLIKNNYLEAKSAQQTTVNVYGSTTKTYNFYLYTPMGQNILIKFTGNYDNEFGMRAGVRKLKSIDFENSYKQNFGVEMRIYSLKFSYTIEPLLSGLDAIKNQIFTGEAQIYKDPNNGEWKVQNLVLSDDKEDEFLRIIKQSYQPYVETQQINSTNSNNDNSEQAGINFSWGVNYNCQPGIWYRYYKANIQRYFAPHDKKDYGTILYFRDVASGDTVYTITFDSASGIPKLNVNEKFTGKAGYYEWTPSKIATVKITKVDSE